MAEIRIANQKIGANKGVFVIAELSANHNQDFALAKKTVKAIAKSGADAVKLQTYTPDSITLDSDKKYFQIKQGSPWDKMTYYKLYEQAYTPWDWQPKLKKYAEELGLVCFSSPFDNKAVDFLEKMDVPTYKIASFEITDVNLIDYVARKKKPVIISTGIAKLKDIELAVSTCNKAGNNQIALLKCTSAYPAPIDEMNLLTIPDMAKRFKTVVGLSDHSLDRITPIVAASLGAKIIEKHFILDRKVGGPDALFSLEPNEFAQMVKDIRNAEQVMGKATYQLSEKQKKARQNARSLFVVSDIKKGERLRPDNIRSIRPSDGLHPKFYKKALNCLARRGLKAGTPLSLNDLEKLK